VNTLRKGDDDDDDDDSPTRKCNSAVDNHETHTKRKESNSEKDAHANSTTAPIKKAEL
jgi:hypothetical protein